MNLEQARRAVTDLETRLAEQRVAMAAAEAALTSAAGEWGSLDLDDAKAVTDLERRQQDGERTARRAATILAELETRLQNARDVLASADHAERMAELERLQSQEAAAMARLWKAARTVGEAGAEVRALQAECAAGFAAARASAKATGLAGPPPNIGGPTLAEQNEVASAIGHAVALRGIMSQRPV